MENSPLSLALFPLVSDLSGTCRTKGYIKYQVQNKNGECVKDSKTHNYVFLLLPVLTRLYAVLQILNSCTVRLNLHIKLKQMFKSLQNRAFISSLEFNYNLV